MKLIAMLRSVHIIADSRPITHTEHLPTLLSNGHTGRRKGRTIALSKLIWIGEGLDSTAKLFSRDQIQILNVVRILRRRFGTRRRFGDSRETMPGESSMRRARRIRKIRTAVV